jgi:hypothetical protein
MRALLFVAADPLPIVRRWNHTMLEILSNTTLLKFELKSERNLERRNIANNVKPSLIETRETDNRDY